MFSVANRPTVIILIQCAPENYFERAHHNQGQKSLPQGFFIRVNEKIRTYFLFPLIKKPWGRGWSKNYSTKKCSLNQGEEKLFFEEGAFFIKDKKVISAKFPLIFRDGMLCMLWSTTLQTTFGIQQRLLVLENLEIVGCGNLTRAIAVLIALS